MAKYDIIVDKNNNEIFLKISICVMVKTPFATVSLDDVCEKTRSIIDSVDNMVKKRCGKNVVRKNGTFRVGFSEDVVELVRSFRQREAFALVRLNNVNASIRVWNLNSNRYGNAKYTDYHVWCDGECHSR